MVCILVFFVFFVSLLIIQVKKFRLNGFSRLLTQAYNLSRLETDNARRAAYEIVLANRYINLGVLYKDSNPSTPEKLETAEKKFLKSLELHRTLDNLEGIAQVSGNLGQLYLDTGRTNEAANLIRDAYDIVQKRGNPISIQYAAMNMGMLADRTNKLEEAIAWYTCE